MEQVNQRPLKLYFLPFLAAGHVIPLCDIATLFASRGQHVTIITTPSNAKNIVKSNDNFNIHTVVFPSEQVGLPVGVESMSSVNNLDDAARITKAAMLLRQPVEHFVNHNPPDCIIADFFHPWVYDLANTLKIPRLVFNTFSLLSTCAMNSFNSHPELRSGSGSFVFTDLPHAITMSVRPPEEVVDYIEPLLEMELKSSGLIVNNFVEMESEYVEHYERTTGHKAWHLGPASLVHKSNVEKADRGYDSVVSAHECLSWLNSKKPNSVVYISFGSLCRFPDNQLQEIAAGIEASGHQFIWVVAEETKMELLPERGMILRGWAPQLVILDHPAVGGFLTHCGWNSVLEGVSAGVPMITWPVHTDHFYNEKLITEVHRIGVSVGAEEWGILGFGERKKLVTRDKIEKAVRRLMDGGDEAEEIRRGARRLATKATQAVAEGGSSHNNLRALIHHLKHLRDIKSID
ncbi:UDP-glucose flavonoid 3-O-glucosyltransferase 7-like [Gastrolobium bilobum]|uniref:UDP-glucose flavonoid 3-O-glucosyltransferase 7-like n=1 Tax=Gastrolobium bilobum TaxID=150636 RepID=UPI002AAFEAF9|nr:UDP-glucose flavonoid 3-O-glucosyltransferase 7-like [Gastrolobium bilobum]